MLITFDLQGLSMRQIRFRFDGQPISESDTPAQVGKTHLLQSILMSVCGSKGFETKKILGLVGSEGAARRGICGGRRWAGIIPFL